MSNLKLASLGAVIFGMIFASITTTDPATVAAAANCAVAMLFGAALAVGVFGK